MLKTRLYTVAVLLPLFLGALFFAPTVVWALLLASLTLVGAWEWGALAAWRLWPRSSFVVLIAAGGILLWHYACAGTPGAQAVGTVVLAASLVFWVTVVPPWLAQGWRVQSALLMAASGLLVLLPLWLALVWLHARPWVLLMLMAIVWISDTAAYACGRLWGRRKLAPTISPGKTWEGIWGAVAGVAVYSLVLNLLNLSGQVSPKVLQGFTGCGVFFLLMALGIEGDLFESWIKRSAGVKDSGTLLPGHGGVLDRVDALTASLPAAALLLSVTSS